MSSPVIPDLTPSEVAIFRKGLGLSQVAFAQALNMSRPAIEKWEKQGAPWYWRYVFAAINQGLAPWTIQEKTPDQA